MKHYKFLLVIMNFIKEEYIQAMIDVVHEYGPYIVISYK